MNWSTAMTEENIKESIIEAARNWKPKSMTSEKLADVILAMVDIAQRDMPQRLTNKQLIGLTIAAIPVIIGIDLGLDQEVSENGKEETKQGTR